MSEGRPMPRLSSLQERAQVEIDAARCVLVEDLAKRLASTPGQVEQTLGALSGQGLVTGVASRGGCGWMLTPAGDEAVDAIRATGCNSSLAARWC